MTDTSTSHAAKAALLDLSPASSTKKATGAHGPVMTRLKADLTAAMKAGDTLAKGTLRMAISAMQNAEVAGEAARALTEPEEIAVLTREVRTRRDSAQIYTDAGRPKLAAQETAEADFLARYLPAPLTTDELAGLIDDAIERHAADTGTAPTMRDMGTLVRTVNAAAAGRAEGGTVAQLVKARLG
ncbi:MAG: GatB/YqeY domain-containing protein [Actinomycetia bacterium]|nr:GatB/YqeY domain-containing protein [Actinomycetes bacterium]